MKKGYSKDVVVLLDGYSLEEKARFSSATEAAEKLKIPLRTIYASLSRNILVYECYFVYSRNLKNFRPKHQGWRRVRGIKSSDELKRILNN